MKQLHCVICRTYKKMEKRKIYLLEKILVFSIISSKCKNENEKKKLKKKKMNWDIKDTWFIWKYIITLIY